MTNERVDSQPNTQLAQQTERALTTTPGKEFLFHLVGGSNLPATQRKQQFLGLIAQEPMAIRKVVATAYYNPEATSRQETPAPTLTQIRTQYPNVITFFSQEALSTLTEQNPAVKQAIEAEKEMLKEAQVDEDIKDVEIALKLLIEHGISTKLTPDQYPGVVAAHTFYQQMAEALKAQNGKLSVGFKEAESFIQIGQNLLVTRRLFEYDVDAADTEYQQPVPSRNADYQGKLAQIRILGIIIGNIRALDPSNPNLTYYRDSLKTILDETQVAHPDRFLELKQMFGLADSGKMSQWVQNFNDSNLSEDSRAEWVDFTHSGNG